MGYSFKRQKTTVNAFQEILDDSKRKLNVDR